MAPSFKSNSGGNNTEKASPSDGDDFNARRSSRVAAGRYEADNDNWTEALAVCEIPIKPGYGDKPASSSSSNDKKNGGGGGILRKFKSSISNSSDSKDEELQSPIEADIAAASQRLTLRPYFQSQNTGQRVWDEPPSGASNIIYATPEARKMAQAQLEEMRSTYAEAAVQRRQEREEKKELKRTLKQSKKLLGESSTGGSSSSKLAAAIPKVFKRGSSNSSEPSSPRMSLLGKKQSSNNVRVKGTLVLSDESGRKGIPKSILEESKALAGVTKSPRTVPTRTSTYEKQMQQAMLMSMQTSKEIGGGSVMGVGDRKPRTTSSSHHVNEMSQHQPLPSSEVDPTTLGIEEQIAMATALSLSENYRRQGSNGSNTKQRSKSTENKKINKSYRKQKSSDRQVAALEKTMQKIKSQKGYIASPVTSPRNHSSSSQQKNPNYAEKPSEFGDDGGGKLPAKVDTKKDGLGERGCSWELDSPRDIS